MRIGVLDPLYHPARIPCFFVHPPWARRGIGSKIMAACERAAVACGYLRFELVATLAGEPLYRAHGFDVGDRFEVPLPNGASLPVVRMSTTIHSIDPSSFREELTCGGLSFWSI